ncbi:MAG TPA: hypothetical protein VF692_04045 [Pyrinomonadaceae bacterium]|jgi:hypothetical protein
MIDSKKTYILYLLLALFLLTLTLNSSAQIVDTPEGKVEFIGLDKWNVERIKAVMAEKAPGKPLGQCAAVLVEIGFPSASSASVGKVDGKDYQVVTLVEPDKAHLLKEKPEFSDSLPDVEKWREGKDVLTKSNRVFQSGLRFYPLFLKGETAQVEKQLANFPKDAGQIKGFFQFLKTQNTAADRDLAVWILVNDGNLRNRMLAVTILANFADSDLTWWTLLDAQRDPFDSVAATASQVLTALSIHAPRKVNWSPAAHTIRYIINGTNVFLFTPTLRVLTRTSVNPELAKTLLKDESHLLLAHLGANYKPDAEAAQKFLAQLSDFDFGYDIAKWKQWVKKI